MEAFEAVFRTLAAYPRTMTFLSALYLVSVSVASVIPAGLVIAFPAITSGIYGVIYNTTLADANEPREAFRRTAESYYSSLLLAYLIQAAGFVLLGGLAATILSIIRTTASPASIGIGVVFGVITVMFYIGTQFVPVIIVRDDVRTIEAYKTGLKHAKQEFGSIAFYSVVRFAVPVALFGIAAASFAQETLVTTIVAVVIAGVTVLFLPIFNALYHTAYYELIRD